MNDKVKSDAILFAIFIGFLAMAGQQYNLALLLFCMAWVIKYWRK